MKKFIVSTTINSPTEAIKKFDNMGEWELIVIGDCKTPKDYKLENGLYVSPEDQVKIDEKLSDAIGWNSIRRRNFGFLIAHKNNADIVATVDDDNIPYEDWGENVCVGKITNSNLFKNNNGNVFDPLYFTNHPYLWHRGFPLTMIKNKGETQYVGKAGITPQVQADLWDGDPDVDAICRMIYNPTNIEFTSEYFPMSTIDMSPFNSQNTFVSGDILEDYFMFPHIGRMDDIWASYYVESCGVNVVYCKPSVAQKRNNHNIIKDFDDEILGYKYNEDLIKALLRDPNNIYSYLPEKSALAFSLYRRHFK